MSNHINLREYFIEIGVVRLFVEAFEHVLMWHFGKFEISCILMTTIGLARDEGKKVLRICDRKGLHDHALSFLRLNVRHGQGCSFEHPSLRNSSMSSPNMQALDDYNFVAFFLKSLILELLD